MRSFLPQKYLQKKLNTTQDVYKLKAHHLPKEWTSNVHVKGERNTAKPRQKKTAA
jgi:hypothetical protein